MQALKREPTKLILILQGFPFPEELLRALSDTILQAWTAAWWRTCLQSQLAAYRGRAKDNRRRNGWMTGRPNCCAQLRITYHLYLTVLIIGNVAHL